MPRDGGESAARCVSRWFSANGDLLLRRLCYTTIGGLKISHIDADHALLRIDFQEAKNKMDEGRQHGKTNSHNNNRADESRQGNSWRRRRRSVQHASAQASLRCCHATIPPVSRWQQPDHKGVIGAIRRHLANQGLPKAGSSATGHARECA